METQRYELVLQMNQDGLICNVDELQGQLEQGLKKYNYIVDEQNKSVAKSDAAKLNNFAKAYKEERKRFKEIYLDEWIQAETKIKAIEHELESRAKDLNNQIKSLDEVAKLQKMEEVRKTIEPMIIEVMQPEINAIQFEQLYIRKDYDKNSMTVSKIIDDIAKKIETLKRSWELFSIYIASCDDMIKECCYQKFVETLDTVQTKALLDDLNAKKKQAEMKAKLEEQKKVQEQVKQQNEVVI